MNQKWVPVLALAFMTIVFLGAAIWELHRSLTFVQKGRKTRGTVLRYEENIFERDRKRPSEHRYHRIVSFISHNGQQIEAQDPTLVMDSPEAIGRSVELYYLTDDPKQIRVGSPLHVVRIGLMLIVAALLSFAGGVIFYKK